MAFEEIGKQAETRPLWQRLITRINRWLPRGLFARAIIIIAAPLILLQSILVFVFMERHWELVTRRLSVATTQDIAALIDLYQHYPDQNDYAELRRIADQHMQLKIRILPVRALPPEPKQSYFDLIRWTLSKQIKKQIGRPFRVISKFRSETVLILIQLDHNTMEVIARKSRVYASNSHIFLVWMTGSSLVLLFIAVLFMRNQIRPIKRLAEAAERFGRGQPAPRDFTPRGATEVRQAALAFIKMRDRIERHVEQRTAMLAGVSHDLRTILTRFRLELALAGDSPELDTMRADVDEMQQMLEDYMAFARGNDDDEAMVATDVTALLQEIHGEMQRSGRMVSLITGPEPLPAVALRRRAIKRVLTNLVNNACRFGETVRLSVDRGNKWLRIYVDDDGPGIPVAERPAVFRPFYQSDHARNRDHGGTGLGLSIARDIARSHGGDIQLDDSALGGVRAVLRLPV